jgi:transcriptional regulator with XRE-family HTH domain
VLDRISKLLKAKKLSSSQFADEIGVQRSSVSHVLSGRNKPSLDFVTKILSAYADVNPDWLLSGMGNMFRGDDASSRYGTLPFVEGDLTETGPEKGPEAEIPAKRELQHKVKNKTGSKNTASGRKVIDKIVLFYGDDTFREFTPDED